MIIPLSEIIINCLIATAKILLLGFGGAFLAQKQILTQPEIRKLSKVLQDLFIPALIFSNFIGVKFDQIISYFPVVIMTIVIIAIGIYVGKIASRSFIGGKEFAVMFPVVCGFAHTINIHLSMVETLGDMLDRSDALANKEYELGATSRGIVFTMINSVVNTIVRWSLMTNMIKQQESDDKSIEAENDSKTLEMKLLDKNAQPNVDEQLQAPPPEESFWKKIDSMLNGPLITAFISLALIMIPPLQNIFIAEDSAVYQILTKTAKIIGRASSSLLLLSLGGNLAGPRTDGKTTPYKALASISIAKLVIMPIIGLLIIFLLKYLSLLEDSVMAFVLFISFAVPTANNILIQYATLGKDTNQLSKVVLASYAFAVISLPFFLSFLLVLITLNPVSAQIYYSLSGYALTDLTTNSFPAFQNQASTWTASNPTSGTLYTTSATCGIYLLGGPGILGTSLTSLNDYFQQTYTSLPSHNIIYYTMNFYAFDSWDANTYDRFQLSFDTRIVNGWMLPSTIHISNICGSSTADLGPIQILGRIAHSGSSLTLKVISLLDQYSGDESFGFRDITMLFATTRTSVTEDICGRVSFVTLAPNNCPCSSGYFEKGYVGSGTCQACHTNCKECFGASERECYTCKPGTVFNGYACISSCHATCSGSMYNCFGEAANNCLVCLSGYYLTDINTCLTSAQCSFPLIQSVSGSTNVCLSPCTWDQYAYKNGSCLSTCPYPLQSSQIANFSLCNSPCSGSQYLYFNQTCRSYCNYPWRTRIEGGIQFCDFPCESPEILYWDQNCRSSCPPPLQLYYESTFKFCLYKCTSGQYLFQNSSCLATCPSPLNSSTLGGANFCNNLCDDSEFLYWNKSCLSECKSPFRYKGDNIADYCLPPCEDTSQYYYLDTGACQSTCDGGIAWSDSLGMYKTCKLISQTAINYMDATDIGRVSILALVRPLEYIRYIDIAVPERLGELMNGQQRNVFSLRFGYKMSASMQAQFTKYEIPAVFERMGLHSSFLVNYWTEITSFAILLIIATVSLFFEKIFRLLEWTTMQYIFERIRAVIKWNVFLIIMATGIADIAIFSMLEFSTFHFLSFTSVISMIACLFMISMLVTFVISILHLVSGLQEVKSQALVSRPHDGYADFLIRWQSYQVVFRGFKDNLIHQQYFYIIYCCRVASPMIIASFVYQIPFMQTIFYTLINIAIIIYLAMKRPLKNKTNWIQLLIIEGITLVINFSLFILSALDLGDASTGTAGIFFGDVIIVGNCCLTLTLIVFLILKVVNLAKAAEILHKKQPELAKATLAQVFFVPIQQCGFGFEYVQVARFLYEVKPPSTEGQSGNTFDNYQTDNDTAIKRFKFSKNQTPNPANKDTKKNWMFEMFAATRSRTKDKDGENYFDEIEDELEIFGKIKNP